MTFQTDSFMYFYLTMAIVMLLLSIFYFIGTSGESNKKK